MASRSKGRQRQRAQLSCDNCRRYKKKCNRSCPCSECLFRSKACSFDRATPKTKTTWQSRDISQNTTPSLSLEYVLQNRSNFDEQTNATRSYLGATPSHLWSSSTSSNVHTLMTSPSTTPSDIRSDLPRQLETFLCFPGALHHIFAAWRREDDWYHEVVLDSPFMTAYMQHQDSPLSVIHRYAGVLYGIVALVAQSHPSELEAILVRLSSTSTLIGLASAEEIATLAEQKSKAWLAQATLDTDHLIWQAEVFQTSFLIMKLYKFQGRWAEYRESLTRDIGRLQRAKYHRLSGILRDNPSTSLEVSTQNRIFWHYFTLERLSSTFDGIPYTIQARNADMWLVEEAGAVHIHQLCSDMKDQNVEVLSSLPSYAPAAFSLTLSPCGQLMARLGALAGRFQDQIAELSAVATLPLLQCFQKGNDIAARLEEELIGLQHRLYLATLPPQHNLLVAIGLARVRRDVSILLCETLQPDDAVEWGSFARHFYRKRLDLTRALIQCAVDHSGRVMLSQLGEPFFTNFICDAVVDLANAVKRESNQQGSISIDAALDDLTSALIGRNLLVVISKQSELAENHKLTTKACKLLANVVDQAFNASDATLLLSRVILDTTRIVAVKEFFSIRESFKTQNVVSPQDKSATEWLDWIVSYPSLQDIFELPHTDLNSSQTRSDFSSLQ